MNPSQKRAVVHASRDIPPGFGTHKNVHDEAFEKSGTCDVFFVENPSVYHTVPDSEPFGHSLGEEQQFINSHQDVVFVENPSVYHDVPDSEPFGLSLGEEQQFIDSHQDVVFVENPSVYHDVPDSEPFGLSLGEEQQFIDSHQDVVFVENPSVYHDVPDSEPFGLSLGEEQQFVNSHQDDYVPTPREKVHEVLQVFREVFRQLDRDKQARRGGDLYEATARIDLKTQAYLERQGHQVNKDYIIGEVPGIQVGDEFQYKAELRLVGLHFRTMCGIDYVEIGGVKFATSIVSSDIYDFDDKFDADVVIYTGEGGNVISKEKEAEDQSMIKGNLALANSMIHKKEVRVIRGGKRWDGKGRHYVYEGLYLVDNYWLEKGVSGKYVYKFKLCRMLVI